MSNSDIILAAVEIIGLFTVSVAGFLIAPWLGVFLVGLSLLLIANFTGRAR